MEDRLKREEYDSKKRHEQQRIDELKAFRMEDRNRLLSRKSERSRLENSIFREASHGMVSSFSSKKDCKQKT